MRAGSPALPEHLAGAGHAIAPRSAPPRLSSLAELTDNLLPLLEDIEARWRARAVREGVAMTMFRTTQLAGDAETIEPIAAYVDIPPPRAQKIAPDGEVREEFFPRRTLERQGIRGKGSGKKKISYPLSLGLRAKPAP